MTNREKYKDEIINFNCAENDFCAGFIKPIILRDLGVKCENVFCEQCRLLQSVWLDEEYKEPEVDWSKVEVDTPLLVGLFDMEKVRYFAYYKDDVVYCWDDGKTSLNCKLVVPWEKARLLTAEEIAMHRSGTMSEVLGKAGEKNEL